MATQAKEPGVKNKIVRIDGKELKLTNLDKIYFPKDKIRKGDVLNYYEKMYRYIIPYLKDRPESLRRTPNGILDEGFFHKDAGGDAPSWVKKILIKSGSDNKKVNYILCNDKPTLLYLNNLGCIELNPWFSRVKNLDKPDYFVIDIDPSPKNTFDEVIEAALAVNEVLKKAKIKGYCKTSGATGMHVYVPLQAKYTYDEVKDFSHIIAMMANELLPSTTSLERSLKKRGNKIYMDFLQNRIGQTLATAYSLRPKEGATVSTPLKWTEVKKGLHPLQFTIRNIHARVSKMGDLFKDVLGKGINLSTCIRNLER